MNMAGDPRGRKPSSLRIAGDTTATQRAPSVATVSGLAHCAGE